MPKATTLDAFPRRPIAVRAGWHTILTAVGSAAFALAALAAAGWFAAEFGPGVARDERVWREGRPVPVTDVSGSCTTQVSWLPFSWCLLDVSYRGASGATVTRPVAALTFAGFDRDARPSAKVDPADAVTLSWFAADLPLRRLALAAAVGVSVFLAGVIGAGGWALLREHRLYRALARAPHPVEAWVLGTRLVSSPGWAREVRFGYRGSDGIERTGKQRLRVLKGHRGVAPAGWSYEEPIRLTSGGDRLLALAGAGGARLVKASFDPLVLTEDEKRRLSPGAP